MNSERIAIEENMCDINCDILKSTTVLSEFSNCDILKQINLKDYIKDIYVSDFFIEWKRNILHLISDKDRRTRCTFINLLLNEVKEIYVESMKDFALKSILSSKIYKREHVVCEECGVLSSSRENIIEKNAMYDRSVFLRHRNVFADKYFLSCPIIRRVMDTAHRILPTIICDFKRYHELGTLTLSNFQGIIFKDIKKSGQIITNKFYTETFKIVQRSKALKNTTAKRLPGMMRCLTTIFAQQILNLMMRSINHIINITRDTHSCPRIEFQLICENDRLVTKPDVNEVFSTYHDIVNKIKAVAQDLMPLHTWLDIGAKDKYIKITPPACFIDDCHRDLQKTLDFLFRPINDYVALVSAEFSSVCASSIKNRILPSISVGRPDFDAYLTRIHEYKEHLSKANSMLSNLHYDVGKLEQSSAKESVQRICRDTVNVLTAELVEYHRDFNRTICSDFEHLKSTALDIPKDAKSLIELSEYVSRASKVLITEQEWKIRRSIYMLSKLSEITVLTDEHIDLNRATVNWLYDIQPVFAQNNTLCEAMKSELEEDLQRRINVLNAEVDAMFPQLVILDNMDDISRIGEYAEYYKGLIKKYNRIDSEMRVINSEERLFKFPETEFPKISELRETILPFYTLIRTVYQWRRDNSVWLNGALEHLDASVIESKTIRYLDEITETSRTMKSRIKMDVTANKSYKFTGIADDPDPMQQPAPLKLCWQALNDVKEFKLYLPLAVCMCNPALEPHHWKEMSAICGFDLTPNAGTTLRKMIDMSLMDNIDEYKAISSGASKELDLRRQLARMVQEWEPMSFEMTTDRKSGIIIFKREDDIEALFTEHLVKIEEMRTSHFVEPILAEVIDFSAALSKIREILDQWTRIQFRKLSLEAVFSYPGIATRLIQENSLYSEATKILSDVNGRISENPNFRGTKNSTDLSQILSRANKKLEKVSRGVKNYLIAKRLSFARFFFLDDSEIQKILFESIDTTAQGAFARKCFAGVERLKFNKSNCIQDIIGQYGEKLRLSGNISISTNDIESEEKWLIRLESEMIDAVRGNISRYCSFINEDSATVPIDDFPSMTIVCGLQIYFTALIEKYFTSTNISALLTSLSTIYANRIISTVEELKNNLTRGRRNLLTSLIVVMSNHNEIVQLLLEKNITARTDFEWAAQLKYYRRDDIVEISVFDATVKYGYEYDYYRRTIVNTPLTDRCFRTIMQACRYHLYSCLIGPTGTGKTETIKGLTRALAKPFRAVNCDNRISYECVTRVLKGAISCGAWVCFENFNGLKPGLLSAVAQHLARMRQAVSSDSTTVNLEGCDLKVNVSGNVCVNVNSERFRYAQLPDNLKSLFRSVSMTAPGVDRIAEIELFAGGFVRAKNLSAKLAVAYKLLSEHLEGTRRYNLGVSSLKAVIAHAINTKQNFPDENEYSLLLRSVHDANLPQLLNADALIFQDIMRDIFPDAVAHPPDRSTFTSALERVCAKRFLTLHSVFELKAVQIVETMRVRRALILVSDPLGGKTEILRTLAETLSSLRERKDETGAAVKLETIVPGAMGSDELFGYLCDKSESWRDGLCTAALRRFAEDTSRKDSNWLVFDGTLNGAWMENLHTVLDDNRMLYLASGERLPIVESTSVIFETASLAEASPSTISRCGIIYIDSRSIGWRPYALSHIAKHDIYSGHDEVLRVLFDWAMDPCLDYLRKSNDVTTDRELHLVASTLNLVEMFLRDACENAAEDKDDHFATWAQAALILSLVWGLGGNLIDDSQIRFNAFCTALWSGANANYPKPDAIKHSDVALPNEGLIRDNFYVFKDAGNWKHFGDLLKNEKIPEIRDFDQIYVPCVDSVRYNYVFSRHMKYRKSFILYGDTAAGKTSLMRDLLSNKLPENCLSNFFSFTSMNTVTGTQKLLLSRLNRTRSTVCGPGGNQYYVNFVDDVGGAAVRRSEAQFVFELLRQFLSYGYCYDANKLSKIFVRDSMFALAITTRKIDGILPSRLSRHFNAYAIPTPTKDNIFKIYSTALLANLKKNLFAADVTGNANNMVKATIEIYESVIKTLRPVPSKLHYFFDMRDISRVIGGCGMIQKESVETKATFVRLWAHEVLRVFGDRLTDASDREWLFLRIRDAVRNNYKDSFEVAFDQLPKFEDRITAESFDDLAFGNFMNAGKNGRGKRYEEIGSVETLRSKILAYLDEYNASFQRKLAVVVSRHTLETLIKISRILGTPGGNLLIISAVGSGRKTTTALAAFMQRQNLFEISECYYGCENAGRDNLRRMLRECGTLQKDVTFFASERQMKDAFLSDVSCLLSTGELPDLFSADDERSIIEMTRLRAQGGDRNAELSARSVMAYFANQCRNRLHFVLCFDPTGAAFRTYLCSYPDLAKYCTVNCYREWPAQALMEISAKYTMRVDASEEIKSRAAKVCVRLHGDAKEMSLRYRERFGRTIHVTFSAFLHMLKLYARLTSARQEEIITMRDRYTGGLKKLELAAEQVKRMRTTLATLKPQLESFARQTVAITKEIENKSVAMEGATSLVKRQEEITNEKAAIANTLKSECEADLAVATSILEDAVVALNTLKSTDIALMKTMKNPPDTVKLVMTAVCVMLDVPPDHSVDPVTGKQFADYWSPSKRILDNANFPQNLRDYDKDNIAPAVTRVIKETYMADGNFVPQVIAKTSSAAENLCKWIRAVISYDEIAKLLAPKKKNLIVAQTEYDEAEVLLNEKRRTLTALNVKLAELRDSLRQISQKKLNSETEVATCIAKLAKAEKLISSLGNEKCRWTERAENLQMNYDNLAGDILLSCGVVAYLASYNVFFRDEVLAGWKEIVETSEIPCTKTYSFASALGAEIEIDRWHMYGLSKNRFEVENAIISKNSEQWCLFVDPQDRINQWIRKFERRNDLKIVKLTDSDCMPIIERNIETGIPVLLENVEERLEIALEPILLMNIHGENGDRYVDIGNRSVKFSQNFRLYVTTRLSSPNCTADIFSKLTIIDSSTSDEILRDGLLDIVVTKEKPELREKLEEFRVRDVADKETLQRLNDEILNALSSTTVDILEDANAMQILESRTALAVNIMKKREAARATKDDIDEFRNAYLRFSDYCVESFRTLSTLSNLNHMYRFSFSWFVRLYITSIDASKRNVLPEKRVRFLKSSFTKHVHSSVRNSLFEKHKLLYSFSLCVQVLIDSGQITREDFKRFLSTDAEEDSIAEDRAPEWLPIETWKQICKLSISSPDLHELANDFRSNGATWQKYRDAVPFRSRPLPGTWNDKLTRFQRLILIKTIRRDKMIVEIMRLIEDTLEEAFDPDPRLRLSESYAESSCVTPIIFILPSYCSSLSLVTAYAREKRCTSKFVSLSMGDEQRDNAEILVRRARREGGWIFLQNCHHVVSWMPRLERICEGLANASGVSPDFRLWLSSRSIPDFPISILQNSVKIAYDCQLRLKQSLLGTYRSEPMSNGEFLEGCPGKDKEFSKLLYGLSFFHAIVRLRGHFGSQGWNVPYDFDHVDLEISVRQLQNLINETENVPFDTLLHLIGECNYGGKIADNFDRRLLQHLLRSFCNTDVISNDEYSFSDRAEHSVPQRYEYRDIIVHINNMESDASPEAFGVDENAFILRDVAVADELMESISRLDRIAPSYREIARDQVSEAINEIGDKLPVLFNIGEIEDAYPISHEPLNAILIHEAELINKVRTTIANSLNDLRKALNGDAIMTDSLEDFSKEICNREVPRIWRTIDASTVMKNLSIYIDLLLKRANFLRDWYDNGLPRIVHFDALSCCKKFLSAALLTYSRRYDVPVEQITSHLKIASNEDLACEQADSCTYYIGSLHLSGARWDAQKRVLAESTMNTFWCDMPPICLSFDRDERIIDDVYECPLYISPVQRDEMSIDTDTNKIRNYVTSVPLKTDVSHVHWIKRGTALFCQIHI